MLNSQSNAIKLNGLDRKYFNIQQHQIEKKTIQTENFYMSSV